MPLHTLGIAAPIPGFAGRKRVSQSPKTDRGPLLHSGYVQVGALIMRAKSAVGSKGPGGIEMKTGLLIVGLLLAQTSLLSGATDSIAGSFYLQGQKGQPRPIDLPVTPPA